MGALEVGQFEKLAAGIYLESLAVDSVRDIVWYRDLIAGVMLTDDGAVLSSGAGGIMWNSPETGKCGWLLD